MPLVIAAVLGVIIALGFVFLPIELAWLACAVLVALIIIVLRRAAERPIP